MLTNDFWMEYDIQTRNEVSEKYRLSKQQCRLLVKAYDDIAMIGGLLCRSHIEKEEIRYLNNNRYEPLPQIMRNIVYKTPKDEFYKYFSPFNFKKYFEIFVKKVIDQKIKNGGDILGQGNICYKKQHNLVFESNEFNSVN